MMGSSLMSNMYKNPQYDQPLRYDGTDEPPVCAGSVLHMAVSALE